MNFLETGPLSAAPAKASGMQRGYKETERWREQQNTSCRASAFSPFKMWELNSQLCSSSGAAVLPPPAPDNTQGNKDLAGPSGCPLKWHLPSSPSPAFLPCQPASHQLHHTEMQGFDARRILTGLITNVYLTLDCVCGTFLDTNL